MEKTRMLKKLTLSFVVAVSFFLVGFKPVLADPFKDYTDEEKKVCDRIIKNEQKCDEELSTCKQEKEAAVKAAAEISETCAGVVAKALKLPKPPVKVVPVAPPKPSPTQPASPPVATYMCLDEENRRTPMTSPSECTCSDATKFQAVQTAVNSHTLICMPKKEYIDDEIKKLRAAFGDLDDSRWATLLDDVANGKKTTDALVKFLATFCGRSKALEETMEAYAQACRGQFAKTSDLAGLQKKGEYRPFIVSPGVRAYATPSRDVRMFATVDLGWQGRDLPLMVKAGVGLGGLVSGEGKNGKMAELHAELGYSLKPSDSVSITPKVGAYYSWSIDQLSNYEKTNTESSRGSGVYAGADVNIRIDDYSSFDLGAALVYNVESSKWLCDSTNSRKCGLANSPGFGALFSVGYTRAFY